MPSVDVAGFRWLPYALLPSAPERSRPQPVLVELRLSDPTANWQTPPPHETVATIVDAIEPTAVLWPVDVLLKNFAVNAVAWYRRVCANESPVPEREWRTWVQRTRALAARQPFQAAADAMHALACDVDARLTWPRAHFRRRQTFDTTAHRNVCVSTSLWAIDQLVREVNRIEPTELLQTPVTALWPRLFAGFDRIELPFGEYDVAAKRIARLSATIRPGHADALMTELVRETLTYGHLKADGELRYPATPSK